MDRNLLGEAGSFFVRIYNFHESTTRVE
jgi:hypothetical protein